MTTTKETDLQLLRKLQRAVDAIIEYNKDDDMSMGTFRVLIEVMIAHLETDSSPDLTQKDIIERTGFEQSSVSRAINTLANNRKTKHAPAYQLLSNAPHPADNRFRSVQFKERGRVLTKKITEALR